MGCLTTTARTKWLSRVASWWATRNSRTLWAFLDGFLWGATAGASGVGLRRQGGKRMISRTPEARRVDSGVYLFALELARPRTLAIGSLGKIRFDKGWYVYVGSARRGLSP